VDSPTHVVDLFLRIWILPPIPILIFAHSHGPSTNSLLARRSILCLDVKSSFPMYIAWSDVLVISLPVCSIDYTQLDLWPWSLHHESSTHYTTLACYIVWDPGIRQGGQTSLQYVVNDINDVYMNLIPSDCFESYEMYKAASYWSDAELA
jgi:hypothetical protein